MAAPIFPFLEASATTLVVSVPGTPGADGADGAAGTDGENAFTTTSGNFTQPAVSANVTVSVVDSDWMVNGQIVYVRTGGYYQVANVIDETTVALTNLGYDGNAAPATVISSGVKVSPGGFEGPTGSSTSVQGVYFSDVDPNGVITATRPAVCYSSAGRTWVKTDAVESNTNWVEVINQGA